MAPLKDKEGKKRSSRWAMENIAQQFYTKRFRSSTLVARCPLSPPDDLLPILESEVAQAMKSMSYAVLCGSRWQCVAHKCPIAAVLCGPQMPDRGGAVWSIDCDLTCVTSATPHSDNPAPYIMQPKNS
ncbi:hypothetical protein Y032_1143g3682 [Ancylostoma ceylanicum]|uniref:Uncharacterized protein n=1 Tax=Ancylostoma ceylanicum TaxID=53326 RepID=A0A016W6C4_9BILA|nr:hypothetical protein Y032_1143g3682 [Ancylostoma ceylanicum]